MRPSICIRLLFVFVTPFSCFAANLEVRWFDFFQHVTFFSRTRSNFSKAYKAKNYPTAIISHIKQFFCKEVDLRLVSLSDRPVIYSA